MRTADDAAGGRRSLLRGSRVRLRVLEEGDAAVIAAIQQDTQLLRTLDVVPALGRSVAQVEAWARDARASDSTFLFAIETLGAGDGTAVIGWIELDGVLWTAGTTSFSIALAREMQGQGYGREALALALDFAFDELNLHRVGLTVFAENQRAIRLYEQLGFVHEGTAREFFQRDGRRQDMHFYGLLRREWVAVRDSIGVAARAGESAGEEEGA